MKLYLIFLLLPFFLLVSQGYALIAIKDRNGFITGNAENWKKSNSLRSLRDDNDESIQTSNTELLGGLVSRRDLLNGRIPLIGLGLLAYGNLASKVLWAQDEISYPEAHERRVQSVISDAFVYAANTRQDIAERTNRTPFRILEVGIGRSCRLIRRGLYDSAISNLATSFGVTSIELSGVDFRLPDEITYKKSRQKLNMLQTETGSSIQFQPVDGSITSRSSLPWSDGYFDSIICCLTLCSVDDVDAAVQNMKRLLRPSGGTLGYVEHVAVNENELKDHRFLELQQMLLDPIQQRLVDNCHLHRYSEESLSKIFNNANAKFLKQERFYVNDMWPVCCQCCGVIQSF